MKKIIKEGTKRKITCEECGCLFSFDAEDIYHLERNEDKLPGTKLGYKKICYLPSM